MIKGSYSLPDDRHVEDLPLTISITMSAGEWRKLDLSGKYPEWQVAHVVGRALQKFDELCGASFETEA